MKTNKKSQNKRKRILKLSKTYKAKIEQFVKEKKIFCAANIKPFEAHFEEKHKEHLKKNIDSNKELLQLLHRQFAPGNIQPTDDFYTYINYEWIKNATKNLQESEKYLVQLDDFRFLQNKVYYQLMDIVKDHIKSNKSERAQQISNVYHANLRLLDDKQLRDHLGNYMNIMQNLMHTDTNNENVWEFLGFMNRNETISFGLPFVFSLNPDDKQSSIYRCFVNQPQLSILDIGVYFDDGIDMTYKHSFRRHFLKYIEDMFQAVFGKNHPYRAKDVYEVEKEILDAVICTDVIKSEKFETYNRVTSKEAVEKYGFNWPAFAKHVGFHKTPSFFITANVNYLKCGTELLLKNWKTEKWQTYFIYIYMRQIIRFHREWRVIPFEFCGKFMRGQQQIFQTELAPVFGLAFSFNTFLTNSYVEKYANPQAIQYVKILAEDLKRVFIRKIKRNTWLKPKTKAFALKKLDYLKLVVGSPMELREDPLLGYVKDDLWINFLKIVKWRTERLTELEGKPVIDIPVIDWSNFPLKLVGTQAYIVNAFYTPTKNGIYMPLAYVQKPFLDMDERGIEYNLAHIGYTLGHEMSHSLDDWGSKYDHLGNLHDWWTPEDKAIFKRKQKDVIEQYEEFSKRDGINFDASMSIGEDLADISGAAILVEYLKDYQENNEDNTPIRVLSFKAFLVYMAIQSRQKISKKAINAQLKTNPHPLDKYRVNVPLSRLEIFRDMYNVKKGDGMYWHNTDTIW